MRRANFHDYSKHTLLYIIVLTGFINLILASCYPGGDIAVSETDVVTTFRNEEADFSTKKTYSMPDSVTVITDEDETADIDPDVEQQILSAIERNMELSGFDLAADPDQADVLVAPLATSNSWVGGGCYPWYWDSWYYYPGWCYPYYYTYKTGTLFIIMVDPEHAEDDSIENALWVSVINGMLSSSSETEVRVDQDIDQAFAQSPYLSDGK
jgi:Domain of unknown function (DUF4136)